ncbi:MAG: LPS assembly lipoprotein LptE [Woeseia sp.]
MSSSRNAILLILLLALAACGFHLRGALQLPPQMARTYIDTADRYSLFYRLLRQELTAAGVELVESAADANAVFSILSEDTDQRVLSVSARNVPREYEVYYSVYFTVQSNEGLLLEPQQQIGTRDYTYDETEVLGKSREEELLREAIARDLVRIVLIQLSSQ